MAAPAIRQFAGDIRFWELDADGTPIPVIPEPADLEGNQPIETNSLSFGYEAGEDQIIVSKRRGARYNQPVHSDQLPGTTQVTAQLLELPPLMLARIMFGEGTGATIPAGSVSGASLAITSKVLSLQLPHRLISATPAPVVMKDAVELDEGVDYDIDLRRGKIRFKSAAVDVDDTDVTISYSYAAQVSTTIVGGATPIKTFLITGDMEDRISGESGELRIPSASLTVDGEVDWLSTEPIQATLTGDVVVADGEDAPYTFTLYKAS